MSRALLLSTPYGLYSGGLYPGPNLTLEYPDSTLALT